jgi:hypothetical protein
MQLNAAIKTIPKTAPTDLGQSSQCQDHTETHSKDMEDAGVYRRANPVAQVYRHARLAYRDTDTATKPVKTVENQKADDKPDNKTDNKTGNKTGNKTTVSTSNKRSAAFDRFLH